MNQDIQSKVIKGERISNYDFLQLYHNSDLLTLAALANHVRWQKHPQPIVTYVIDRNINYTDICISACKFCAFFKSPEESNSSLLSHGELIKKIEETQRMGGNQVLLQGGLHPDLKLEYYEEMLRVMKKTGIHIHGFSPPEIIHFASLNRISSKEVLQRLIKAGLDSMPGGGAEILVDRVRKIIAPLKATATEWIRVMEEAHELGMKTTATMMFGHIETIEERVEHLAKLRALQDKTKGFTAFIPWPFQPDNTPLGESRSIEKTSGHEYLKMLALSRIFLDNFANIQASWVTQGAKIAQLSLNFGANDFGSTMIEENVVAAAGVKFRLSEQEIKKLVQSAGFIPKQRRMDYSII